MPFLKHSHLTMIVCVFITLICSMLFVTCNDPSSSGDEKQLTVSLTFKGPRYQGNFYSGFLPSSDMAIWVTNSSNHYIKTLKINVGAVKIGEHGSHTGHLPAWLTCTGDSITESPDADSIPERYDGITGASYQLDEHNPDETVTATWDFTDTSGATVPEDTYYFYAEVANIQKDSSDNDAGYTYSIRSESTSGTVTYPSGATVDATPTTNITSCTGTVE